jgi:hypothetical protein
MPRRICPICKKITPQHAYGLNIPDGGAGWYYGTHYMDGMICPASSKDVAIVAAQQTRELSIGRPKKKGLRKDD